MAGNNGHKKNNDDVRKEFADLSLRVQKLADQREEDNQRSEKNWQAFEKALKDLAAVVVGVGGSIYNLYSMQEGTDRRLDELEKHVTNLVLMMNVTNGYLNETNQRINETNQRINETNQRMIEMNNNFSEFLKLEKMRIRNGHNGSGKGKQK